ncbi:hypothetical protein SFR_7085 (plasmid) [Streptomyces sp. FR-008]|nr:hypothetical protein SFR_7085 [Streptomyces sp. FR-008]
MLHAPEEAAADARPVEGHPASADVRAVQPVPHPVHHRRADPGGTPHHPGGGADHHQLPRLGRWPATPHPHQRPAGHRVRRRAERLRAAGRHHRSGRGRGGSGDP